MVSGRRPPARVSSAALLDIGTHKVACLVLEVAGPPGAQQIRYLGSGLYRSQGLKAGVVVDLDQAEAAVRAAVHQAERMAGVELTEIFLSVGCGRLTSLTFTANAETENGIVTNEDVARLTTAARSYAERDGRMLLHMNRIELRLDGAPGMREPRGMAGHRLACDWHAVIADDTPVRNLMHVVERCDLRVAGLLPAPVASGYASTTADERRLGVVTIDIGAGTTTMAAWFDGHLVGVQALPVGGGHVTYDIARTLNAPVVEAERIKTLYASLQTAHSDQNEILSYRLAGDTDVDHHHATRALIHDITMPRIDGLLGLIGERLGLMALPRAASARIVLTGGTSLLAGLAEYAGRRLGAAVRIGRPFPVGGFPESVLSPVYSTCVGLTAAALDAELGVRALPVHDAGGYLGRVGQWIRESF